MATNYVQEGETVTLAATRTVESGEGMLAGHLFGVALADTTSAATGEFATCGVWELAAATSSRFTQGQVVYWDNSAHVCDDNSTSNSAIGTATVAKTGATATVTVRLDGVAV